MAANNKVFILDKYFKELQKFWETGKMLQGNQIFIFFNNENMKLIKIYQENILIYL